MPHFVSNLHVSVSIHTIRPSGVSATRRRDERPARARAPPSRSGITRFMHVLPFIIISHRGIGRVTLST
jgi:hypothetical protein